MILFGHPLTELFLYFMLYSFLGWLLETCYCSIRQRHFVPRGFLYGPVCPIYGAGVLLMIVFFTPLKSNLLVFYVVAVLVMSAWEYFVGWLLEVTTHVKYWDYSQYRFNLKGRICLWVALVWGALSYVVIFWIHPPIEQLYARIPPWLANTLSGILLAILLVDTVLTVRHLALISRLVSGVTAAAQELQLQLTLGKAELNVLESGAAQFQEKYGARAAALRESYHQQIVRLEQQSRRFRRRYVNMRPSDRYEVRVKDILEAAESAKEALRKRRTERKEKKASRRDTRE